MKQYIFLFGIFFGLTLTCVGSEPDLSILDLGSRKKLFYQEKQEAITKSKYNKFESVYVFYPQLSTQNKSLAITSLNAMLKSKTVEEQTKESFKFDFLNYAYHALNQRLGNPIRESWQRYTLEAGLPVMNGIKGKFLFLSGNILAYQVQYQFSFEYNSRYKVEHLSYVKTYYLHIGSGKVYSFSQLINPTRKEALLKLLEKKLNGLYDENSEFIKGFTWEGSEEINNDNEEYDESEEEEFDKLKIDKANKIALKISDLDQFYLDLTPFQAQIVLPPQSASFDSFKQLGLILSVSTDTLAGFLLSEPMFGNWLNERNNLGSQRKSIDILRQQLQNPIFLFSPLQNGNYFEKHPPKGAKSMDLYQLSMSNNDTLKTLLHRTTYDSLGRMVKQAYGNNDNPENWVYVEYDSKGNIIRELSYQYKEVREYKTFSFDANNCLQMTNRFENNELLQSVNYFYRKNKVYECPRLVLFQSMEELENAQTRVFELDSNNNILSNYPLGQQAEYINRYDGNRLMASYSIHRPNLDNWLYSYSEDGLLEMIISDNGRRVYYFTYADGLIQSYRTYDGQVLQERRDYIYDEAKRLVSFSQLENNGSRQSIFKLDYRY